MNDKKVVLNTTLVVPSEKEDESRDYDLVSVIAGGGIARGHYLAYVKGNDGKWKCYNDNAVKYIDFIGKTIKEETFQRSVAIAIYCRVEVEEYQRNKYV